MSKEYWEQYRDDLNSMLDILKDDDTDIEQENDEEIEEQICKYCSGSGCNRCLMIEW